MKKENIIDDNDLMKVSGGKTRPRKAPPTYTDYMPDDYMINGNYEKDSCNIMFRFIFASQCPD